MSHLICVVKVERDRITNSTYSNAKDEFRVIAM